MLIGLAHEGGLVAARLAGGRPHGDAIASAQAGSVTICAVSSGHALWHIDA
jgi:hypothetical protein